MILLSQYKSCNLFGLPFGVFIKAAIGEDRLFGTWVLRAA